MNSLNEVRREGGALGWIREGEESSQGAYMHRHKQQCDKGQGMGCGGWVEVGKGRKIGDICDSVNN